MADFRQLHARMWSSDTWFSALKPEQKLLFIYLFSNERASVCGLYELPMRIMSVESGLDREQITRILEVFAKADKVAYDFESGVVWVKNMHKYQTSSSPKLQARIKADIRNVPDCTLKTEAVLWLSQHTVLIQYADGSDTPLSVSVSDSVSVLGEDRGTGEGEASAISAWNNNSERDCLNLYTMVTGQIAIPSNQVDQALHDLDTVLFGYYAGEVAKAIQDGKRIFSHWCQTRGKSGKKYSPTNTGWLTWWLAEKAPRPAEETGKTALNKALEALNG